jgi:hypothetical protein
MFLTRFKTSKNIFFYLGICILIITIIPYLFLAFFSVPAADDFVQASDSLERGLWEFIQWRYFSWSGRYSSDFIIASYNLVGHQLSNYFLINFYYIIPLFLISSYFIANFSFIALLVPENKIKNNFLYALIVSLAILTNTDLNSTVFWLSGGATYALGNSLFIISLGLTIYTLYLNYNSWLFTYINIILILFINGLSESIMISYTIFFILIFILNLTFNLLQKKEKIINLYYLISAIASAIVVYIAPGNSNRLDAGKSEQFFLSFVKSFSLMFHYIFTWINPFWICLVILLIVFIHNQLTGAIDIFKKNQKILLIIIFSLIVSFYMSYFVRWYSLGGNGPLRANSISYTIFFTITIMLCILIGINLDEVVLKKYSNPKIFLGLITMFCCFSLGVNYQILKHDFRVLKSHHQYYQTYYPLLINAQPNSDIKLPPEPRVKILRFTENYLTDNKNHWINRGFARYFHINSVISSQVSSE